MKTQELVYVIFGNERVNTVTELSSITFKVDKALRNQIEELAQKEFLGKKSPLIKKALVEFLDKKEQEYRMVPEDVKDRVVYILNLVENGNLSTEAWDIVRNEVKELWENIKMK